MRKAMLLLLISIGLLWGQGADRKARMAGPLIGSKVLAQNDRIAAAVGSDGRFTFGTRSGKPLLYGFSREGATSHTHFYVDGEITGTYSEGLDHPPAPDMVMSPTLVDGGVECKWLIDSVLVTQRISPTHIGSEGKIFIEYTMENLSSEYHSAGILLFLDTKIGSNDYAPIATEYGYFSIEREFTLPNIPEFWQAYESSPFQPADSLIGEGILSGSGAVPPDKLIYGDYWHYKSVEWEYEFIGGPYSDSSILLRWDPQRLAPGESRYISSYYGEGNVSSSGGSLALSISSPSELRPCDCDELTPNPFNVNVIVANNSPDSALGVICNLILPEGMSLVDGALIESTEPPSLAVFENGTQSWQVMIDDIPSRDTSFTIGIVTTAHEMGTFEVYREISVTASDLTAPSVTLISPSEYSIIANTAIDFKFILQDESELILDSLGIEMNGLLYNIDDTEHIIISGDTLVFKAIEDMISACPEDFSVSVLNIDDIYSCTNLREDFSFVHDITPPTIELLSPERDETIYSESYQVRVELLDDMTEIIADSIDITVNSTIDLDLASSGISYDGRTVRILSSAFAEGFPSEYDLEICISNVMDNPEVGNPNIAPEECYDFHYNGSFPRIELLEPELEGFVSCDTLEGVIGISHPAGIDEASIRMYVNGSLLGDVSSPYLEYSEGNLNFYIPVSSWSEDSLIIGVTAESMEGIESPLMDWICHIDHDAPVISQITHEINDPEQLVKFLISDPKSGVVPSSIHITATNFFGLFVMDVELSGDTAIVNLSDIEVTGCDIITFDVSAMDNSNVCGHNFTEISFSIETPCSAPTITSTHIPSEFICNDTYILEYNISDDEGVILDELNISVGALNFGIYDDEVSISGDVLLCELDLHDIGDGIHDIELNGIKDIFDNLSAPVTDEISIDHSAPVLDALSPETSETIRDRDELINFEFVDEFAGIDFSRSVVSLPHFGADFALSSGDISIDISSFDLSGLSDLEICFVVFDISEGCGGNSLDSCITYSMDFNSPVINLLNPDIDIVNGCEDPIQISITDSDGIEESSILIVCEGASYSTSSPEVVFVDDLLTFTPSSITEGELITISIVAADIYGNETDDSWNLIYDFTAPVIEILQPISDEVVNDFRLPIKFLITDNYSGINLESLDISINSSYYTSDSPELIWTTDTLIFTPSDNYSAMNTIEISISDNANACPNVESTDFTFYAEPEALNITAKSPNDEFITGCEIVDFTFTYDSPSFLDCSRVRVLLNDEIIEIPIYADGNIRAFALETLLFEQGFNTVNITSLADRFGNFYPDTISYIVFFDNIPPVLDYISHAEGIDVHELTTIKLLLSDVSSIDFASATLSSNANEISSSIVGDTLQITFNDINIDTVNIDFSVFDDIPECANEFNLSLNYPVMHPEFFVNILEPLNGTISHKADQRIIINTRCRNLESAELLVNSSMISTEMLNWDPISERFTMNPEVGFWNEGENNINFSVDDMNNTFSFILDTQAPEIIDMEPADGDRLEEIPAQILIDIVDEYSGLNPESFEISIDGFIISPENIEYYSDRFTVDYPEQLGDYEPGDSIEVIISYFEDGMPDYGMPNMLEEEFVINYIFSGKGWKVSEEYIFTPNGDGVNDELIIKAALDTKVKIFNMKGREIYNIKGSGDIIWNGNDMNGKASAPGLYMYIIEQSGEIVAKGTIVIAR